MSTQQKKVFASTQKYNELQNVYWTDIGFCQQGQDDPEFIHGLWDTGCTVTTVSKCLADKLALPVIGKVNSATAGGLIECDRHIVNIYLPNKVRIANLIIMSNPILTVDCLIGTDIICKGDFSVSNFQDKTTVSFRMPSQEETDYTDFI